MKRTFGLDPTSEIDLVLKTRKEVRIENDHQDFHHNVLLYSMQDEYEYVMNEEDHPLSHYDVGNDDVILIKTK